MTCRTARNLASPTPSSAFLVNSPRPVSYNFPMGVRIFLRHFGKYSESFALVVSRAKGDSWFFAWEILNL